MDLSELKSDAERSDWVREIPDMGDLALHVRGIGNADYRKLMTKLVDAVPRSKKVQGRIEPTEMDRIQATCLNSTVLLGWDNLNSGGKAVPYDKETASKLLTDPKFRRFRDAVIWAATLVAETEEEADAEDAGNLQLVSTGT